MAGSSSRKPGIYIHIPFCEQRCYYCAFTVAVSGQETWEPYVRRLIREIELARIASPMESPETIFLGGGTPSIIEAGLIEQVLHALPLGAEEITIESNPGTLGGPKLERYRELGINRISLGAQSFHDEDLKNAGRLHSARDVFSDFEALRKTGFTNVNIDLIAGLPDQRFEVWQQNLDWIECLRPEHVSIYMLELEERSAWGKKLPDSSAMKDEEDFVRFYEEAASRLEDAGYVHYEISNWALPGFECRHNLKYWSGASYRGLGVSAHSFDGDRRFWNTVSLKEYAEVVDAGKLPVAGEETITPELRLQESFLLGLRQMKGFDIQPIADRLGFQYPIEWFARLRNLEEAGLVVFNGTLLKLSPKGWLLANSVTQELVWPTLISTSEATR
jgi:oxygen-independent coproporphyrinogen III oxidase